MVDGDGWWTMDGGPWTVRWDVDGGLLSAPDALSERGKDQFHSQGGRLILHI